MFLCNSWSEKRKRKKFLKSLRRSENGNHNQLSGSLPNLNVAEDDEVFENKKLVESAEEVAAVNGTLDTDAGVVSLLSDISPQQETDKAAYLMRVHLQRGADLVAMDSTGSSDPYVKFKYNSRLIYKSETIFQNLNPHWDEYFEQYIEDVGVPLKIQVYDFDRFSMDDFMGGAAFDLSTVPLDNPTDLKISLTDGETEQETGCLFLNVSLKPKSQLEMIQMRDQPPPSTTTKRRRVERRSERTSVVHVVLVEAKQLRHTLFSKSAPKPDPYVKMRLGEERVKSRVASKTLDPKFAQEFVFHPRSQVDCSLELQIFDKRRDSLMGKCVIDLTSLEQETSHHKWYDLEGDIGKVLLVVTISGLAQGKVSDLGSNEANAIDIEELRKKYSLKKTLSNDSVGCLIVKMYKAQGLASLDIGGKSDPFCVLELVNSRLQTNTIYKTLSPEWNKVFTFNVSDVNSVLELTVYDEDPNKKIEFMGRVAVPLLKIKNQQKRWYALKNEQLLKRAKGKILLEMILFWNPIRAAAKTFAPKELKYVAKGGRFKRRVFLRNMARVKRYGRKIAKVAQFVQSCFTWRSPLQSLIAFLAFLLVAYFFELYMLPLALAISLLLAFLEISIKRDVDDVSNGDEEYVQSDSEDEDDEDEEEDKGPASLSAKLEAVQAALLDVQNSLGFAASTIERIRNTFNFTQPFCSYTAMAVIVIVGIVLYLVPVRWLILAWGVNKFTKRFRQPRGYVDNNEVLDFLSRVPCDKELKMYGEYHLMEAPKQF